MASEIAGKFIDWGETEEACPKCNRPRAWFNKDGDANDPIVECTSEGCRTSRGIKYSLENRHRLHKMVNLRFSTPIS